jgi:hypothetical protein
VTIMITPNSKAIAALNDQARHSFTGCRVLITQGIQALTPENMAQALDAVRSFDKFTPDNDPYAEHDFGRICMNRSVIFWKFDYYDPDLQMASLDPGDPTITTRVLTIMMADEY